MSAVTSGRPVAAGVIVRPVALRPLNKRRWALAVVLSAAGLVLAVALDLRMAWTLVVLGQALLFVECLSRLGDWPLRGRE
jgi:hypothetical protein